MCVRVCVCELQILQQWVPSLQILRFDMKPDRGGVVAVLKGPRSVNCVHNVLRIFQHSVGGKTGNVSYTTVRVRVCT